MPNTFVVGGGPVAIALAGSLRLGGAPVLGLWARNADQGRRAGAISGVAAYTSAPPDIVLEASCIVLAVSDDAIAQVAEMLVGTGLVTPRHVLLHCSGAVSAETAFAGVASKIGGAGVLHPLRAIADGEQAMRQLEGVTFGIEGDETGIAVAQRLVAAMGGTPLKLTGGQLTSYHAAAAVVSNYMVALFDVAAELLVRVGIERDEAISALVPLARGTVDNLAAKGLPEALTGPIRRGDSHTVERHLEALSSIPEARELYSVLGRRVVDLAKTMSDRPSDVALETISALLRPTASR